MDDAWLPFSACFVVSLTVTSTRARHLAASPSFERALRDAMVITRGAKTVGPVGMTLECAASCVPGMADLAISGAFVVPRMPTYPQVCELAQRVHALCSAVDISTRPSIIFTVSVSYSAEMRWEERNG